jgi:hypothetical protein
MNHLNKESLYKFVLEILDEKDSKLIAEHINSCELCSEKTTRIKEEIKFIGSYDTEAEVKVPELPHRKYFNSRWFQRAAILILGFLIGYSASTLTERKNVRIVEQNLIPKGIVLESAQFVECPNIDIYASTILK